MKRIKEDGNRVLILATLAAALVFILLYWRSLVPIEKPETVPANALADWDVSQSALNGAPFEEDKGIYTRDTNIYDVYISVFPTKNEEGEMIDFSAFDLHQSFNHDYNPVLNCNIQILPEGKTPDPLLDLNQKNAVIRVRGNGARGRSIKSYKVILEEEAGDFMGQTNLNINKHIDASKIATKLQTDLLAEMDDIGSYRAYFMRVWIRDTAEPEDEQEFKYYGLYIETEQPNKTYLKARSLSTNAVMYKARNFNFSKVDVLRDVDDPLYSEEEFEKVLGIREGNNHKKLLEMLEAVNDTTRDFEETFKTYFNEDNYLTWMAFNLLMGNEDFINQNYIIYSPENSITWYFVPWDLDGSLNFGEHVRIDSHPIMHRGAQLLNQCVLHRRYLRIPGSVEKIQNKMRELLETNITRERVTELLDSYKPVLEKTVTQEAELSFLEMKPNELFPYWDTLYDGIMEKYEEFSVAMDYPAPMFVARPERYPDGSLLFAWDPAFSYQGRTITYSIQIYEDYNMQNLVYEADNILDTEYIMEEGLERGTYYLMTKASDSAGNEQISMERFVLHLPGRSKLIRDGLLEFTLD